MSKLNHSGFSLIEWIAVLGLLSLFTTTTWVGAVRLYQSLSLTYHQHMLYHTLHYIRSLAQVTGQDHSLHVAQNQPIISPTTHPLSNIDSPINVHINGRGLLGFKPNGNTKYAGTLRLILGTHKKAISLGIGKGVIRFK